MNTLKKDWRHDLGIGHVLQVSSGAFELRAQLFPPAAPAADADGPLAARRWCGAC